MFAFIKKYEYRRALSATFAVMLAWYLQPWISFEQDGWMPLAALLMSQSTQGSPVRQGLSSVLSLFAGVLLASMVAMYFSMNVMIASTVCIFMFAGYLLWMLRPLTSPGFNLVMCFAMAYLLAAFMPIDSMMQIKYRCADVVMGGVIGIASQLFIFPVRVGREFSGSLQPLLMEMSLYLRAYSEFDPSRWREEKDKQLSRLIQTQTKYYPEWVYELGFNPGLRAGFRFFLIHLERVIDMIQAFDYLSIETLPSEFHDALKSVVNVNADLVDLLSQALVKGAKSMTLGEMKKDVEALNEISQKIMPGNFEILMHDEEAVSVLSLTRLAKDMRQVLLTLLLAVPA